MIDKILLIVAFCLFTKQMVIAQAPSAVTVSNTFPEAGQSVTIVYNPRGTVVEGKVHISVMIYYWKNIDDIHSDEIKPIADGNTLRAEIKIPDSVKVFALKFFNGENVDGSNGKGYIYPIYKNGQVVQGAMGIMSQIYFRGDAELDVKVDLAQSKKFMQQEFEKFPSSKEDFVITWYFLLAASSNEEDKALLEKELYALLKIDREREWEAASYFFAQINKVDVVDSVQKEIPRKFPKGELARKEAANEIYEEKDAKKMELMYKAWIKKFPPNASSQLNDDYVRAAVGKAFAKENSIAKALEYANMIQNEMWSAEGYAGIAEVLMDNGHYSTAKGLLKRAIDNSYEFITTRKNEEGARFAVAGYPAYNNMHAEILYHEKKYQEALAYVKKAFEHTPKTEARINSNYAKILIALGQDKEAFEKIEELVKTGHATAEIKAMLRSLYVKLKSTDAGYDEYIGALKKELAVKMKEELARKMINLPAPLFELKDLTGKTVSLKDLKGKTVILDFWATWCAPCIRSFPAMKIAVNKYKDDRSVKFLFIHTMENVADATTYVKKFIEKNNYRSFQVLMDLKNSETGSNPVVESFKVNGIPAKFVIDKNGNIRFSLAGFDGAEDAAVEEIIVMIELAQKS